MLSVFKLNQYSIHPFLENQAKFFCARDFLAPTQSRNPLTTISTAAHFLLWFSGKRAQFALESLVPLAISSERGRGKGKAATLLDTN